VVVILESPPATSAAAAAGDVVLVGEEAAAPLEPARGGISYERENRIPRSAVSSDLSPIWQSGYRERRVAKVR
jgi:hypothetical protein